MARGISEVDPVLDALGGRGRYQCLQFLLMKFAALSTGFQLLNIVFVGRSIPHVCSGPGNATDLFSLLDDPRFTITNSDVQYDKCNIRVTTNTSGTPETKQLDCVYGFKYDERKDLSIMSDMDVVCEKSSLKGLGQTFLIMGQGLGAFTLPIFSDRFGRRPVLLVSHLLMLGLGIGVAFSPSYVVFLILRVLLGAAQQGVVLTMSTFAIEMFPARHRKLSGLIGSVMWSAVGLIIPLIAYLARDLPWRTLQLIYCSVSLYVFAQYFLMDESLRWLMANGKHEQIVKNLTKAARISGKSVQGVLNIYERLKEKSELQEEKLLLAAQDKKADEMKPENTSFLAFLRHKRLALNVAVLWFTWMTDSMTFFGMFMTIHKLVGSRFLNFTLFAIVESPAAFVNYAMVDRYGRRKTSMTLHLTAGLALIIATIIRHVGAGQHSYEIAVTVFSCVGVFGITGAWGASFFFTPEMFPTNLRNFGLGTSSSFSRIGGMLAPFAGLLAEYVPWAPGAVFGGCCLLVSILVNLLPETMGRELPQTLEDLLSWYRNDDSKVDSRNGVKREIVPDVENTKES